MVFQNLIFVYLFVLIITLTTYVSSLSVLQDEVHTVCKENSEYVEYLKADLFNPGTQDAYVNFITKVKKEIPADAMANIRAEQLVNNKYVPFGIPISTNLCDFVKHDETIIPAIMKYGNFTRACPYVPGVYVVTNYSMSHMEMPIPLPTGSYRVHLMVSYAGEESGSIWTGRLVD